MEPTVRVEEHPNPDEVQLVRRGLREYNLPFGGQVNHKSLAIFLRDGKDEVVGGLLGGTYWGYLYIDVLWVKETHRNQGHGRELLNAA